MTLSQENCPPCKDAMKDVAELREKKIPVYVYDATDSYGSELAERYKVDKTPTFVVLDAKYNPATRFVGAGVAPQIADAYNALVDSCPISLGTPTDPDGKSDDEDLAPTSSPGVPQNTTPPSYDFRTRPAVYDVSSDVGFLEVSNNRWLNRGRKEEPKQGGKENENSENRPKFGEKLADSAVDAITTRIEKKINDKADSVRNDLRNKWNAVKYRLAAAIVVLVALALLLAEGAAALAKRAWRKTRAFFNDLRDYLKNKEQK